MNINCDSRCLFPVRIVMFMLCVTTSSFYFFYYLFGGGGNVWKSLVASIWLQIFWFPKSHKIRVRVTSHKHSKDILNGQWAREKRNSGTQIKIQNLFFSKPFVQFVKCKSCRFQCVVGLYFNFFAFCPFLGVSLWMCEIWYSEINS